MVREALEQSKPKLYQQVEVNELPRYSPVPNQRWTNILRRGKIVKESAILKGCPWNSVGIVVVIKTFVIVPTTVTKTEMKRGLEDFILKLCQNSKPSKPNWDGKKPISILEDTLSSVTEITITNTKGRIQERGNQTRNGTKEDICFLTEGGMPTLSIFSF